MGEIIFEDRHYREATSNREQESARLPIPASVRFDETSGRIVVDFTNGAAFMVPVRSIQGLEKASVQLLHEVELLGETGLHWENLDVDYTIAGLMRSVFSSAKFMDAQRRGGQSTSDAKTAAARSNGLKGGRPRKTVV